MERKLINLAGNRYGRVVAIEIVGVRPTRWRCSCDCGATFVTTTTNLRTGGTRSCGCVRREKARRSDNKVRGLVDLTGQRFGRLVVVSREQLPGGGGAWLCDCDCGNSKLMQGTELRRGHGLHCGCQRRSRYGVKPTPIEERFLRAPKIMTPTGCIEWQMARDVDGYGLIGRGQSRGNVRAHRMAWELARGPIPDGMWVLHKCDNPPCCNPEHLFLGDNAINSLDRDQKGRCRHVARGSLFTEQDVSQIRYMLDCGVRPATVAKIYDVKPVSIHRIKLRKSWKHVV